MTRMYIDICTSHLTPQTVDDLTMENVPVIAYTYEEGMFISVPNKDDFCFDHKLEDLPSDLIKLLRYAWENYITLIRLDRDGDEIPHELPIYRWD